VKLQIPKQCDYKLLKTGDMPGDKVEINETHVNKTKLICRQIESMLTGKKQVIAVHGGSGVGKSETASVLGYILNENGIKTYILSGDNYPRRFPEQNDAERIRVFREYGLKGLVKSGNYTSEARDVIFKLKETSHDLDIEKVSDYPFLKTYIEAGKKGLDAYLGTKKEIDFDEINDIISEFKKGSSSILLKRMGRSEDALWYDAVDFSDIDVLIVEWTHGNNVNLQGVDIPILLNSTPEETLAHRLSRSRDGKVDSPFVKIVLELEQAKIVKQAASVKVIITKSGDCISYDAYLKLMG
jgi:alpha-galactosidase